MCMAIVHDDPRIIRLKAKAFILEGSDLQQGLNLAKKAYSMKVSDPKNYHVLGLAYKKLGNVSKAIACFQKAVQLGNHEKSRAELKKLS